MSLDLQSNKATSSSETTMVMFWVLRGHDGSYWYGPVEQLIPSSNVPPDMRACNAVRLERIKGDRSSSSGMSCPKLVATRDEGLVRYGCREFSLQRLLLKAAKYRLHTRPRADTGRAVSCSARSMRRNAAGRTFKNGSPSRPTTPTLSRVSNCRVARWALLFNEFAQQN